MTRVLVSIADSELAWLEQQAVATGLSIAELILQAIREQRRVSEVPLDDVLQATRGLWRKGDGLAYQRSHRREW